MGEQVIIQVIAEPLTVNQTEAARLVGVSEATIWRWARSGLITSTRKGGMKLIHFGSLKKFLEVGCGDHQQS